MDGGKGDTCCSALSSSEWLHGTCVLVLSPARNMQVVPSQTQPVGKALGLCAFTQVLTQPRDQFLGPN